MAWPLPDTDFPPTREFWAAAARETLSVPRCQGCHVLVWYPAEQCPRCEAVDFRWEALSGRGTLFSWAVVERALFAPYRDRVPYVPGLVALEEDPRVRIVSRIVDCEPSALVMDMPVRVVFRPLHFTGVEGEVTAPFFTPVGEPRPRPGRGPIEN